MTENKKIAIIASALLVLTFALCHVAARLAEFKAGMYMNEKAETLWHAASMFSLGATIGAVVGAVAGLVLSIIRGAL